MIIAKSFESVSGIAFNSTTKLVQEKYGFPEFERKLVDGSIEWEYPGIIFRFDSANFTLDECTLTPFASAAINGLVISWENKFLKELMSYTGNYSEVSGFIVFWDIGVAVSGFEDEDDSQKAITVFKEGHWDEFKL